MSWLDEESIYFLFLITAHLSVFAQCVCVGVGVGVCIPLYVNFKVAMCVSIYRCVVGDEWLYHDSQEPEQHVWYCYCCQLLGMSKEETATTLTTAG